MSTALYIKNPTIDLPDALKFTHVFQPIFSLQNDTVVGFESLIRGKQITNPQLLFSMAEKQKKLFDLDVSSVIESISRFNQLKPSKETAPYLTVNIYPSTLLQPAFFCHLEDVMRTVNLPFSSIIFEINEAETVENIKNLQMAVRYLKSLGFIIALDDLGKGQSSLRIALELEPNMVKLDQYFCVDLDKSIRKQRFLDWIVSYFRTEDTLVTLEGIETESQLSIAKQIGIPYGQGYYLGKPQPLENYYFHLK